MSCPFHIKAEKVNTCEILLERKAQETSNCVFKGASHLSCPHFLDVLSGFDDCSSLDINQNRPIIPGRHVGHINRIGGIQVFLDELT